LKEIDKVKWSTCWQVRNSQLGLKHSSRFENQASQMERSTPRKPLCRLARVMQSSHLASSSALPFPISCTEGLANSKLGSSIGKPHSSLPHGRRRFLPTCAVSLSCPRLCPAGQVLAGNAGHCVGVHGSNRCSSIVCSCCGGCGGQEGVLHTPWWYRRCSASRLLSQLSSPSCRWMGG